MRAKVKVSNVVRHGNSEHLTFTAVCKNGGYPPSGLDENNSYATWTPNATFTMSVTNPALHNKFALGDEYYVDFTKAE